MRRRKHLTLPAIRAFREAIIRGELGMWLVDEAERVNAGRINVKYNLKKRPWIITVEARRKDNK